MRITTCKSRKNSGFTLLEMMLALVIFSLLSVAGWQLLSQVSAARDSVADHERRLSEIDLALLMMKQDFRQLVDRGVRTDGQVSQQSVFHGDNMIETDDQAISFVRTGWRNPGQRLPRSEQQRVYYRLKDGVLERWYDLVLDVPSGTEPVKRNLLSDVESLKFYFFYNNNWHPEVRDSQHPQGIRAALELEDLGMIERDYELPGQWELSGG